MSGDLLFQLRRSISLKTPVKGKLHTLLLLLAIMLVVSIPFAINYLVVESVFVGKKEPPDSYFFSDRYYPLKIEKIIKFEAPLEHDVIIVFSDGSNTVISKEISSISEDDTIYVKHINKNNKYRTHLCIYDNESICEEILHFNHPRMDVFTKQQGFIRGYKEPESITKNKMKKQ